MEFRVQFCGNGWKDSAILYPSSQLGTEMVKRIRSEKPSWEKISIVPEIPNAGSQSSVTLYIPEKRALDIPVFRDRSYIEVAVPEYSLSRYGSMPVPEERRIRGRLRVIVFYQPNESRILDAWGEAGYPIVWNPENPGQPFPIRDGFFTGDKD